MPKLSETMPATADEACTTSVCRLCGDPLTQTFIDLGLSPLANRYLTADQLEEPEPFYPLHAFVCGTCLLVQLEEFESPDSIFTDYAYFASYSDSWVEHARRYSEMAIGRFGLTGSHRVVEIASNDGYLLQHFKAKGIDVLGVEPAANVAAEAVRKGIPTRVQFFGEATASKLADAGIMADLLVGNNVLAHVPNLNDFIRGMSLILRPRGVITMEFPHLLKLVEKSEFDTIYHEHFSYFSLITVEQAFARHGLRIFDVEELSTHGGSLRIYVTHAAAPIESDSDRLNELRARETKAGLRQLDYYRSFAAGVAAIKHELLHFLSDAKRRGKAVVGYGAPAKGNTLLNYCGIGPELLQYTVDRSPHKQGRVLPGVHVPIFAPEKIRETRPDYVLILPWNLKEEIMEQTSYIRSWGGRFVVPIPKLTVYA
jgi:SAM-dependent methyltransferase